MPYLRRVRQVCCFVLVVLTCLSVMAEQTRPTSKRSDGSARQQAKVAANYGDLPLAFEPNLGQAPAEVRFSARAQGATVLLKNREVVLISSQVTKKHVVEASMLRMLFVGASSAVESGGVDLQEGISNYLLGNDPAAWRTHIPNFGGVRYTGIYPGVDLVFYGSHRTLEHDFVIGAGADYRQIRVQLQGSGRLELAEGGSLRLRGQHGSFTFPAPQIYQDNAGERIAVPGGYRLLADNEYGFEVGSYDRRLPLIIDPVLIYSTYLAGSSFDQANAVAVDSAGNAYITGSTLSNDFPTLNAEQSSCSGGCSFSDAFVTKLNPLGTGLVYSTFVGGTNQEIGNAIAVDALGNVMVAGITESFDFPTKNPIPSVIAAFSTHGFAFSLTPAGDAFNYSTYLGGIGQDFASGVATDTAGNAYISGQTSSSNFPLTPGNQIGFPTFSDNVFLVKLSPGGGLAFSTLIGGATPGLSSLFLGPVVSVAVDPSGEAILAGGAGFGFPTTPGSFQPNSRGGFNNAFLAKLSSTGSSLLDATYLGGSSFDAASQVAIDGAGNIYAIGTTNSQDFPVTAGAFQTTPNFPPFGIPASFVAKLDPTLSTLDYATFLEGTLAGQGAA